MGSDYLFSLTDTKVLTSTMEYSEGQIPSPKKPSGRLEAAKEELETQSQRRVYDLLAAPLPQAGRAAEVPPEDADRHFYQRHFPVR